MAHGVLLQRALQFGVSCIYTFLAKAQMFAGFGLCAIGNGGTTVQNPGASMCGRTRALEQELERACLKVHFL